jgi:hypothetical protein
VRGGLCGQQCAQMQCTHSSGSTARSNALRCTPVRICICLLCDTAKAWYNKPNVAAGREPSACLLAAPDTVYRAPTAAAACCLLPAVMVACCGPTWASPWLRSSPAAWRSSGQLAQVRSSRHATHLSPHCSLPTARAMLSRSSRQTEYCFAWLTHCSCACDSAFMFILHCVCCLPHV